MLIQEIAVCNEKINLVIDGKEYIIMVSSNKQSVTVCVGRWITDRRGLGKTFWDMESFVNNYKKHGKILSEYVAKVTNWK